MVRTVALVSLTLVLLASACAPPKPSAEQVQGEVQKFLDDYTATWLGLYTTADEAEWVSNTYIVEGDDTNRNREEAAREALTAFTGSVDVINTTRKYLESRDLLTPLQVRQLETILHTAANYPQTIPDVVAERIRAEALQTETLFGYDFKLDGKSVSANDLDDILEDLSQPMDRRLAAWESSKEVGVGLRDGLTKLVGLRNKTVQNLGYPDFFAHEVALYGMTSEEMMNLLDGLVRDIWPLYRELHTWTRYELAKRYGVAEVPDMLPAHWLPNRWGQSWAPMVTVAGLDINPMLAQHDPEWVVRQAEDFYVSLGFEPLPQSFWEKSSLYPAPPDASYKKNNHASAWHIDLDHDVRSLMSVQANERWWSTTHHELGHIYYYLSYSRPEVPPLLRRGANRAFHEGIGTQLGMVSLHRPFLIDKGLVSPDVQVDEVQQLLKEALETVVFIPFSAGTMSHFEHDLYSGAITADSYNRGWWDYVRHFQGIVPPGERGENYCDAATKTHINDDPAQYYDYALSHVILHQLHDHIATQILHQDVRNTNYYGRKDVGDFLRGILSLGATEDWRQVMRDSVGEELSAKPMLSYFEPLMEYLKKANEGRVYTLPETPEG